MTPKKLTALRAARAAGKGLREAGRAANVSHQTVKNWERKAASKSKGNHRPSLRPVPNVVALNGAEADAAVREPLPQGLAELRPRLALFTGLLERLAPAVERDEYPAANFVTLSRHVDELKAKAAELEPPASTESPAEKADDREAARIVLARLESMVGDAEAQMVGRGSKEVG
jgi:hypothetical protein